MNSLNEKQIELITGYLQNSLSEGEREEFNSLIESGEMDLQDIREMESLYSQMGHIEMPEPTPALGDRFYSMLEAEMQKQNTGWMPKIAMVFDHVQHRFQLRYLTYAVSIFLAGLLVGDIYAPISNQDEQIDRLSTEVYQLREMMMISLLDDSSPIERLKAVNISNEIPSVDSRVIDALLRTLNNDSNVNVRLAAVEALVQHASNAKVRQGLVSSITRQESPIVQSALADAMLTLQEKQSVDEFKKLLDRNELDNTVRDKLETTIAALN
ncbi:HEAT repeat domain-containing protein [Aliifodinibius sp. S!AR15-10]|uniref:HEAT repeat domain-containing protein n=1 Tax=Aliifodinibius sp. S!AR15-10 TaxID=2950437 RepID=UPI002865540E|nr:HEAT repeat domain-containing protein [Aliifodinibius sp. S!AR15-10]MDR8390525.1 HEAT repeat domain-containing protein [Aliifodinibius sp. S!AR15-10]